MDATNSGVVDYSFALSVASALMGLIISVLPWRLDDRLTRLLLLLANLAAVLYTAQSINGSLDLQHSAFAYLILAGIIPAGHYSVKLAPKETGPAAVGGPEAAAPPCLGPLGGGGSRAGQKGAPQPRGRGGPAAGGALLRGSLVGVALEPLAAQLGRSPAVYLRQRCELANGHVGVLLQEPANAALRNGGQRHHSYEPLSPWRGWLRRSRLFGARCRVSRFGGDQSIRNQSDAPRALGIAGIHHERDGDRRQIQPLTLRTCDALAPLRPRRPHGAVQHLAGGGL